MFSEGMGKIEFGSGSLSTQRMCASTLCYPVLTSGVLQLCTVLLVGSLL